MADLKSIDFQVVGRCLLCAALGVALLAETPARASERTDRLFDGNRTQLAQSSASDSIANIQRLLTILADRYTRKFGEVNPGRVDGSYGAETKAAIRKYQEISGIKPGSQTNEQLVADILATLAQMSASQPEEEGSDNEREQLASLPPREGKPAAPGRPAKKVVPESGSAGVPAAKDPAAKEAKQAVNVPRSTRSTRTRSAYAAPVPPAKVAVPPAPAEQITKTVSQAPATPASDRVYFSQLASLRTLEAAQREWQRIFEANRAALNGEQVYFEEADIAGRGTFHRILVGPIVERDAAQTLCGFLKQNDQPCVVISRLLSSLRNLKDKNGKLAPIKLPASGREKQLAEQTPTLAQIAATGTSGDTSPSATSGGGGEQTGSAAPTDSTAATAATAAEGGADQAGATAASAQELAPVLVPIEEASKVFDEKATGNASETTGVTVVTDAADSVAVAVVAIPPIDTTAPPGPSNPAPAQTTTGPAAATAPAGAPDATRPAPDESKTATLVPFSRSPGSAPTPETIPGDAAKPADAATPPAESPARDMSQASGVFDGIGQFFGGTRNLIGVVVIMLLAAAALLFVWWRRTRRGALAQIFRPANYSFGQPATVAEGETDTLTALETDFDSEQLRESRSIRDEFLRDILGDEVDLDQTAAAIKDPAIRINSSLKSLLVSDPAQYKSIFLNWIFLSKVGAALNQHEISMEDLNGNFGREFKLLQNYFKIHLLELDDRHRIRKELPGLFYCLQLAQQRQRQAAGTA